MIPWASSCLSPCEQRCSFNNYGLKKEIGMTQTCRQTFVLLGIHGKVSCITIPHCYSSVPNDAPQKYDLHVFCDASEWAYGAVAYLLEYTEDVVHTSFVMARSQVAPRRQQSMPCLELCAALAGAQLAKLLRDEITLTIQHICPFRFYNCAGVASVWLL